LLIKKFLGLFFQGRCGFAERKHFVFASNTGLDLLSKSENWYADGTFRVVPTLFYQLFTIQVQWEISHKTVPVVYVLMSGKTTEDYVEVFKFLKVNLIF
jgi:hypothetical protein